MIVRILKTSLVLVFALAMLLVVFFVAATAQFFQEHTMFFLARSLVFFTLFYMVLAVTTIVAELIEGFKAGFIRLAPIALELLGGLVLAFPLIFAQTLLAFVQ